MAASGIYVYGIVGGSRQLPVGARGVGEPPADIRLLPAGDLAVVISAAPPGLRARRRDLMAHQGLLLTLAEAGPVLPMRFGVVAPDEATVLGDVAARRSEHAAVLERLDGHAEMNVKVMPVQDDLEGLIREDPVVRRIREETRRRPGYEANIRLGEAVAAGLRRRAAVAAARLPVEFAEIAGEMRPGPDVEGCVLNASFLVPRGSEALFRDVAEQWAAHHRDRLELRLTGPLPCYSFVAPESAPARV
ncbi:GvpL/GvpF family gas vesicle protein [Streptomyces sp. NBC_00440]|uniref:GvpL/GvpF family gas vesicle protein n=1 Tax=unclassified Streptomyces TaxID=2593676 RepID=UPI002258111C|nr:MULTISPECIES: GvpL/GvpF family gas vesicle protein [unclassified Streptomyces]MCX4726313.1 GvpL/GvpF family gas vesicle protein [Streptomyces sp. NBC_01306]WSX42424.1 GvpL/GvpF family gas vesicle protein [Streptomyces sp. NBC_00963]